MRLRFSRRVVLIALLLSSAACTAILGTYDTTDGTNGSSDAGLDASKTDGSVSATDGATPSLANCTTWAFPTPIPVGDLTGAKLGTRVFEHLQIIPSRSETTVSPSPIYVVAGRTGAVAFTLYTIDTTQTPPTITSLDVASRVSPPDAGVATLSDAGTVTVSTTVFARSTELDTRDFSTVVAAIETLSFSGSSQKQYEYAGWMINEETLNAQGAGISAPFLVYSAPIGTTLDDFAAVALSENELLATVVYDSNGTFTLGAAHVTEKAPATTLTTLQTANSNEWSVPRLIHLPGSVQIFAHATVSETSQQWSVNDTGPVVNQKQTDIGPGTMLDLSPNTAPNVLAFRTTSDMPWFFNVYAQTLTNAGLANLSSIAGDGGVAPVLFLSDGTPNDAGDNATSQAVVADGENSSSLVLNQSEWYRDQAALIARPLLPDGGPTLPDGGFAGMNFAWVGTQSTRALSAGVHALLQDRANIVLADAYPLSASGSSNTATWAVVWVEQSSDASGPLQRIYMNELQCK